MTDDPYELLEKHDHIILDDKTATKLDKQSFAIQLVDESMSPHFFNQDLIIITPCSMPKPGTFVLATIKGSDKAVFRKYREISKSASGEVKFELLPLNNDWPTITVNNKNDGVILGTMVELRRYA